MNRFGPDAFAFATASAVPFSDAGPVRPSAAALRLKSAGDRVAALLLLVVLLLPMVAVAVLIRLDSPGPVLFRQARVGRDGAAFTIWKFRTMQHAAADAAALRQTSRDDARVTRLGRTLRRLSLDELPQLVNVLRGDMSLVGPRPHTPGTAVGGRLLPEVVGSYHLRHQVKPGITGWAQVNGSRGELRTEEDVRRRVALDLSYIDNWSPLLDGRVLWLTVKREFFSVRAY